MLHNGKPELYLLDTYAMREMLMELGGKTCRLEPLSPPCAVWVYERSMLKNPESSLHYNGALNSLTCNVHVSVNNSISF